MAAPPPIPPVLVLNTGRCGSTMISDILNRHPRILSLSEFFSFNGLAAFTRPAVPVNIFGGYAASSRPAPD